MNKELLLRIADHIERHPHNFDMSTWLSVGTGPVVRVGSCKPTSGILCVPDSSACIGGWAIADALETHKLDLVDCYNVEVVVMASLLLDLAPEEAKAVFHSSGWDGYSDLYDVYSVLDELDGRVSARTRAKMRDLACSAWFVNGIRELASGMRVIHRDGWDSDSMKVYRVGSDALEDAKRRVANFDGDDDSDDD